MNDIVLIRQIAEAVRAQGGNAYFVGGCVRDELMGHQSKDYDVEIHGIEPAELETVLSQFGSCLSVGKSFGIYSLKGHKLDIALPRRERAVGSGHRDFICDPDPFIGPKEACRRRDFTINAIMKDVLTGEILDPYLGQQDLTDGVLRHVDPRSFPEDPLRVLRGAQFSARFGFIIADETLQLCSTVPLKSLAKERVFGELEKALLQAPSPSRFFTALSSMHQLNPWFSFTEGYPLQAFQALDHAAEIKSRSSDPLSFLLSVLLLPLSENGEDLQTILSGLTANRHLQNRVLLLLDALPKIWDALSRNSRSDGLRILEDFDHPQDLVLLLNCCDEQKKHGISVLEQWIELYTKLQDSPQVTGKLLTAHGLIPGPRYSIYLAYAKELWLRQVPFEKMLELTLDMARNDQT